MSKYPLVSALSRPLIVTHLARVAKEKGATVVAHGCTGKGNDQVRFEVGLASLAPEAQGVRAGPRLRDDQGQGDRVRHGQRTADRPDGAFAVLGRPDLWGRSCETGHLEDIWEAPHDDVWAYCRGPWPAART